MALEHIARMREALRVASSDGEPWFGLLSPDVRFDARVIGRPDLTETLVGLDGVREWFRTWVGAFESWTPQAEEMIDLGDRLVVGIVQRGRGKASGAEVEQRHHELWAWGEDGLAEEIRLFEHRDHALEAAGLAGGCSADVAWRVVGALNRWDPEAWVAVAHPDMSLSTAVLSQVEDVTFHGHQGIRDYMRQLEEGLGRPRYDVVELLESEGRVCGRARIEASGPRSGATLTMEVGILATTRDGLVAEVVSYPDADVALREFGIEP